MSHYRTITIRGAGPGTPSKRRRAIKLPWLTFTCIRAGNLASPSARHFSRTASSTVRTAPTSCPTVLASNQSLPASGSAPRRSWRTSVCSTSSSLILEISTTSSLNGWESRQSWRTRFSNPSLKAKGWTSLRLRLSPSILRLFTISHRFFRMSMVWAKKLLDFRRLTSWAEQSSMKTATVIKSYLSSLWMILHSLSRLLEIDSRPGNSKKDLPSWCM